MDKILGSSYIKLQAKEIIEQCERKIAQTNAYYDKLIENEYQKWVNEQNKNTGMTSESDPYKRGKMP
jgi:hypothetical protein